MFLTAAPYFHSRFEGNALIQSKYQSAILTTSTLTSLGVVLLLTKMQKTASYPFRIASALIINTVVFVLLTVSTTVYLDASPGQYLTFVLIMVMFTSCATGLLQNGTLAFASSFGRPEYMQGLVAGQAIAGILPALAQLFSVLIFPPSDDSTSETSAFVYFLAAVAISLVSIAALLPLVRRHGRITESRIAERLADSIDGIEHAEGALRKVTSLQTLFTKLRWLSSGVALIFTVTMFFPVFTSKVLSVQTDSKNPLFRPEAFISLAFFFWNLGDLAGRMATVLPIQLTSRPFLLFVMSVLRVAHVPLYLLCNVDGRGAVIGSDFFYLFLVQLPFGFTNGWLCSRLMTSAADWVEDSEREAAGSFMGMSIMAGLAAGSLLSFTVTGI